MVGNVLTATAGVRTVFTLGVNADGSWTFDLDDQLDHVDASGDAGFNLITAADGSTSVPSIDFSSILVATDFDGDSVTGAASGSFTIAVENDVPIAAVAPPAVSATVVEDALLTTAPGDTGDLSDGNLDAGQDNSDDEASGLAGSLTTLFEEGADEPLTYTLSTDTSDLPTLFSQGEALTYSVVGNVLTATAGVRGPGSGSQRRVFRHRRILLRLDLDQHPVGRYVVRRGADRRRRRYGGQPRCDHGAPAGAASGDERGHRDHQCRRECRGCDPDRMAAR